MPTVKPKVQETKTKKSKSPLKTKSIPVHKEKAAKTSTNIQGLEERKARRAIEREEKLMKSFRSLDNYLAFGAYTSLLVDVYVLYLTIKSHGNPLMLAAFVFSLASSVLLIYSSRLFSRKDKRAVIYYTATFLATILFLILLRFMSGTSLFMLKDIVSYLIPMILLVEMYKLQENGILG